MLSKNDIQTLYNAGAHVGYIRARRHPTAAPYLFGTKDRTDIFNLEETNRCLDAACLFVEKIAEGAPGGSRQILFVGGKHEVSEIVKRSAQKIDMPYVAGRWIGGSLTNFKNVRKRIERMQRLMRERESGELEKYTKHERLLIDREIDELLNRFGGLSDMEELPAALFIVDTRHEHTAAREAKQLNIPIIGLSSSDGDFSLIAYPIPANDTSQRSVQLVCDSIVNAYVKGSQHSQSSRPQKSSNT